MPPSPYKKPSVRSDAERNVLVMQWRYLPVRVARSMHLKNLTLEEAVAAGMLGLIRAASLWDPKRKIKFTTYAWKWVMNAIQSEEALTVEIHVPYYTNQYMREKRLSARVEESIRMARAVRFLDSHEDNSDDPPAFPEKPEWDTDRAKCLEVQRLLEGLNEEERELIHLRYYKGLTLKATGDLLGISRQGVQMRERQILAKLRKERAA